MFGVGVNNIDFSKINRREPMIKIDIIIQAVIAISGVVGVGYAIIKDKIPNKNGSLKGIKSILNRREEIRGRRKYVQDLELKAVPCLKGFQWIEVDILLEKDVGMLVLSNLKALSRKKLLVVYDNKIVLPNRWYIIKKYIFNPISYVLIFHFIFSVWLLYCSLSKQPLDIFQMVILQKEIIRNVLLFLYIIFSEMIALYYFDSLISFDLIEESGDIAGNDIFISQDFDKELRLYDIYKLQQSQKKLNHNNE